MAIDDATRLAYVEVLPDEKQATTVGFLLRAVAWFDGQGISGRRVLSDNGSAYRSKPWREACSTLGLISKRNRPYSPQTNGKAERFIKTLLAEWAYSMAFQTSTERNRWLPLYLAILNDRRCHIALAGRNPIRSSNSFWLLNDLLRKIAKSAGLALCHSERHFLGVGKNSLSGWK